jgi:hypothetical protein
MYRLPNPRVYHGSPHLFNVTEGKMVAGEYGPGFYFTTDLEQAVKYARKHHHSGRLYLCDVEFKKPLYHHMVVPTESDMADADPDTFWKSTNVKYGSELYMLLEETKYGGIKPEAAIKVLRKLGYDGIIVYLHKSKKPSDIAISLGLDPSNIDVFDVVKTPEEADRAYYIAFDLSQVTCATEIVGV